MKITRDQAEAYFAHPTQRKAAMLDGPLPDAAAYHAGVAVCLAFHDMPWPGVIGVHIGVKPEAWGQIDNETRGLLVEAWREYQPDRIAAWIKESNRAACALARRVGFELDGVLGLPSPVIMYGWRL